METVKTPPHQAAHSSYYTCMNTWRRLLRRWELVPIFGRKKLSEWPIFHDFSFFISLGKERTTACGLTRAKDKRKNIPLTMEIWILYAPIKICHFYITSVTVSTPCLGRPRDPSSPSLTPRWSMLNVRALILDLRNHELPNKTLLNFRL